MLAFSRKSRTLLVKQTPPCASARSSLCTHGRAAGALSNLKKLVFMSTLLLALVGGAGQASADQGKGGTTVKVMTSSSGGHSLHTNGITWESAGITWD